jgi:predicted Ser/Thr protein kinase/Mrp family chromosome partitioning ATPase
VGSNDQTLSEWAIGSHDGTIVDVDDGELDLELDRLKRSLGLDPSGRTVGRFRILSQLGKGGMGVVYAAEDPDLDRTVALKLVRSRQRGSRVRLQARLQREARALGRLTHQNVVRVYDVGSDGDELFIAMELVDGPTLLEWQSERERSLDELLKVYLQAAAGLAAAHDGLLVHRDFKPENVFVTSDGRVLVGDFGLANLEDAVATTADDDSGVSSAGLTEDGTVLGTLGYMAPEQLRGDAVDARADQFAFCVALWEAIAGERPFVGNNTDALLAAIEAGDLQFAERVPRPLRAVLRRGLSYARDDRFAELRELVGAIEEVRDRKPWLGIAVGLTAIAVVVAAALLVREEPQPCAERERIDRVWAEGRDGIAERFASVSVLDERAEAAVAHLGAKADLVCLNPNENRRRVLGRSIDEFAAALAEPQALELHGWIALIESLESLDLDRPAIDPAVAAAIDRSRLHEWHGNSELAWKAAAEGVSLALETQPSGWSASMSEALLQRGRMLRDQLDYNGALSDFASAEAHAEGSGHGSHALWARLEAATVLVKWVRDPNRARTALARLEPLLLRQSQPLSPERATAHELHSSLAALQGQPGPCIGHGLAAAFIHVVVHPDPVATSRIYVNLAAALATLGLPDPEALYARGAELLIGVPAANDRVLTLEYDQALLDIEADDPLRQAKGRATLERLRHQGGPSRRVSAARALLYLALRDDDLPQIRTLLHELRSEPGNAEDPHVLIAEARLGSLDLDALDRARTRTLEHGNVSVLADLEYELAQSLRFAACDLAGVGIARLDQIEATDARENSRADFERLLVSLDCE